METITLNSHVGADGILKLQIPVKVTNADLEVVLIVQRVTAAPNPLGWPDGFFEEVAGGWQGGRLVREDQNEAIDKLREYRTALISAAVTGKIDVRPSPRPSSSEGEGARVPSPCQGEG